MSCSQSIKNPWISYYYIIWRSLHTNVTCDFNVWPLTLLSSVSCSVSQHVIAATANNNIVKYSTTLHLLFYAASSRENPAFLEKPVKPQRAYIWQPVTVSREIHSPKPSRTPTRHTLTKQPTMDDIDLKSVLDQVGPEGDKLVSSPLDGRDQPAPSPMRTEVSMQYYSLVA